MCRLKSFSEVTDEVAILNYKLVYFKESYHNVQSSRKSSNQSSKFCVSCLISTATTELTGLFSLASSESLSAATS